MKRMPDSLDCRKAYHIRWKRREVMNARLDAECLFLRFFVPSKKKIGRRYSGGQFSLRDSPFSFATISSRLWIEWAADNRTAVVWITVNWTDDRA